MAEDRKNPGGNGQAGATAERRAPRTTPAGVTDAACREWLVSADQRRKVSSRLKSIYTWKGYQDWAARIRNDWEPENN